MLSDIEYPEDLKKIQTSELPLLCQEIRNFLIEIITKIGGHLGAALGVVELTTALHYVFDAPKDTIIWDIGHQAHVHKILTGRKNLLHTTKKNNGLSGFCSIFESPYDSFGAGHSSTSVSAALGFLVANNLSKKDNWVVATIGDGSMGAGMVFEALNNVPKNGKMLIILNDNDMSICKSVGNISDHFKGITTDNIFTNFGIKYIGVEDGHNVENLIDILQNIKQNSNEPTVLHIKTKKGYGYNTEKDCAHSVSVDKKNGTSYTQVASQALDNIFSKNNLACAITPAMIAGSGLVQLREKFADRVFDVGIAEQHAVTFSAGLARAGMIPFCAIYSTFLQRGYDQVIHDVAIQKLPVRFLIDRAGFVGGDGATHHGSFDVSMLLAIPNFVVMAPSSGQELVQMINTCLAINDKPSAVRYPRDNIDDNFIINDEIIEIGKGKIVCEGEKTAILSLGTCLKDAINAAKKFDNITIFDLRFAKPIDRDAIIKIAKSHDKIISIEDGGFGGIGSVIAQILHQINYKGTFKSLHYSDEFFTEHADVSYQKSINKIDEQAIIDCLTII